VISTLLDHRGVERAGLFSKQTYYRGTHAKPLRCGHASWGFRHIKDRWDAAFDGFIALTIARGESVPDLQQDGGSRIYALFDDSCLELFRVIYNGDAYLGNDVSPQGIVTAFYSVPTTALAPDGDSAAAESTAYRTDCAVDQEI
jgi:hypothetical protein